MALVQIFLRLKLMAPQPFIKVFNCVAQGHPPRLNVGMFIQKA
jgi:hypothetical protein